MTAIRLADCRSHVLVDTPFGRIPAPLFRNASQPVPDLGGSEPGALLVLSFNEPLPSGAGVYGSNRRSEGILNDGKTGARPGNLTARSRNAF